MLNRRDARVIERAAWSVAGIALALGFGWMIATPPGIFSDSVSGFMVVRSMERGAALNHTLSVDLDDISVDRSEFTAWWTPGQYLVPMPFLLLGLDLGTSMLLTVSLAWAMGALGFFFLWRRLGFAPEIVAASVAVAICQSYVLGWGRFYHGGALLEWAYVPWFTLAVLRWQDFGWTRVPMLALALTLGIAMKSSFAIVGSAIVGGVLWARLGSTGRPTIATATGTIGRAALSIGLALAALYAYAAAGRSPAGRTGWSVSHVDLREILFATAAPVSSLFDLWQRFLPNTESVVWPFASVEPSLAVVGGLSLLLIAAIVRSGGTSRAYASLLVFVVVGTMAAYALAWTLDLLISFHVRHFRVAGVFVVPGLLAMLARIPLRAVRAAAFVLVAALCVESLLRFAVPSEADPLARPVGASGFSHIYASQSALDAVADLDRLLAEGNNLFAVPWPQMGLDVRQNRVYDMRTGLVGAEHFRHHVSFGRVDDLIVIVPIADHERGATPMLLRMFREHDDWRRIRSDVEDFVFMHSGDRKDLR